MVDNISDFAKKTLYVGVNQTFEHDQEYFTVRSNVLADNEVLRFTTREAAEHVESVICRAYEAGKLVPKKELLNWLNN